MLKSKKKKVQSRNWKSLCRFNNRFMILFFPAFLSFFQAQLSPLEHKAKVIWDNVTASERTPLETVSEKTEDS